jgi:hypothetical protein
MDPAKAGIVALHLLPIFLTQNRGMLNRMTMEVGGSGIIITAVRLLGNSAIGGKIVAGDTTFIRKKFAE